jgi:phosphoglycolate phosphatase
VSPPANDAHPRESTERWSARRETASVLPGNSKPIFIRSDSRHPRATHFSFRVFREFRGHLSDSPMKKLILWDIDGTLIRTNRAGIAALVRAFAQIHGREPDMTNVEVAGRTDRFIIRRMLEEHRLEPTAENVHAVLEGYLQLLQAEIQARPGRILPGILELLETLHRRTDVVQGLLTGNVQRGARIKLEHFRVWHYFEFGAFGDDSALRNELGPHALRRAQERHEIEFVPDRVFVIGDTPHDIECGKVIGARTIGVATGTYTVEQLAAHQPTAAFQDFSDPAALLRVIEA